MLSGLTFLFSPVPAFERWQLTNVLFFICHKFRHNLSYKFFLCFAIYGLELLFKTITLVWAQLKLHVES